MNADEENVNDTQGRRQARAAECLSRLEALPEPEGPLPDDGAASPVIPEGAAGGTEGSNGPIRLNAIKLNRLHQTLQSEISQGTTPPHRHPKYAEQDERIKTFSQRTTSVGRPNVCHLNLALAGFFSRNTDPGYVRCFHCDGVINIERHCKKNVNPATAHVQRHPACRFAQLLIQEQQRVENESHDDEPAVLEHEDLQSGMVEAFQRIATSGYSRENQTESSDSSDSNIDDSSAEQSFWKRPQVSDIKGSEYGVVTNF